MTNSFGGKKNTFSEPFGKANRTVPKPVAFRFLLPGKFPGCFPDSFDTLYGRFANGYFRNGYFEFQCEERDRERERERERDAHFSEDWQVACFCQRGSTFFLPFFSLVAAF